MDVATEASPNTNVCKLPLDKLCYFVMMSHSGLHYLPIPRDCLSKNKQTNKQKKLLAPGLLAMFFSYMDGVRNHYIVHLKSP